MNKKLVRDSFIVGAALFSMFGILLFIRDAAPKLAGTGISAEQAGDILSATADAAGSASLDPQRTAWVISEATSSMLEVAQTLNLVMAVLPVAAAVAVLVLFRRDAPRMAVAG